MAGFHDANVQDGYQLCSGVIETLNKAGQDESLWKEAHLLRVLSLKNSVVGVEKLTCNTV